jgi:hypothetical protein
LDNWAAVGLLIALVVIAVLLLCKRGCEAPSIDGDREPYPIQSSGAKSLALCGQFADKLLPNSANPA